MKNRGALHWIIKPLIVLCAALLSVATAIKFSHLQSAGDGTEAFNGATRESQFPSLDRLPGKVPPRVSLQLADRWEKAHQRWKASASHDVGAVVFLGDSITEGWKTLASDFPNLKVANRGIGGDITSGVLYRLKADVLSLNPPAIVLLIGTNDLAGGAEAQDVAANIRLILLAIKSFNPNVKVIVCKIMPRSENGAQIYAQKIQTINSLLEQMVKGEPNVVLCDTWGIYADEKGNPNPADFNPDHLHLNPTGYVAWKSALDPVIARLNLDPTK